MEQEEKAFFYSNMICQVPADIFLPLPENITIPRPVSTRDLKPTIHAVFEGAKA